MNTHSGRGNDAAGKEYVLQRWMRENFSEQAWNIVGDVTKQQGK